MKPGGPERCLTDPIAVTVTTMNTRKLALLCIGILGAVLSSGCATHTANNRTHTVVLGGLFELHEGAFEQQPANTLPLNMDQPYPGSRLTGTKVSLLWGLMSYRDQ